MIIIVKEIASNWFGTPTEETTSTPDSTEKVETPPTQGTRQGDGPSGANTATQRPPEQGSNTNTEINNYVKGDSLDLVKLKEYQSQLNTGNSTANIKKRLVYAIKFRDLIAKDAQETAFQSLLTQADVSKDDAWYKFLNTVINTDRKFQQFQQIESKATMTLKEIQAEYNKIK
jgi:hypothetical protein